MSAAPSTRLSRKRAYSTLCETMDDALSVLRQKYGKDCQQHIHNLEKSMMNVHYVFKENEVMHHFLERARHRHAEQKKDMASGKEAIEAAMSALTSEQAKSSKLAEQNEELKKQVDFLKHLIREDQQREMCLQERVAFLEANEHKYTELLASCLKSSTSY